MEKLHIGLDVCVCAAEELGDSQRKLVELSRAACSGSYSPYSGFAVGAAVELDNGETFCANNQENAAYPSGLCAERNVLFYAKASCPDASVIRMVLSARKDGEATPKPVSPCGACRQVMLEVANRQLVPMEIILAGKEETYVISDAKELLPLRFDADDLK